jgi:hypothetical protein
MSVTTTVHRSPTPPSTRFGADAAETSKWNSVSLEKRQQ